MSRYKLIHGIKNEDLDQVAADIMKIENVSWNLEMAATLSQIYHRLDIFSDGLFRLVDSKGKALAYTYCILLKKEFLLQAKTWNKITNEGLCGTNNAEGDVIFGVTLGSLEPGAGKILINELFNMIKEVSVFPNCNEVYLCGRIPSLSKYIQEERGLNDVNTKLIKNDPTIRLFMSCGFEISDIVEQGYSVDKSSLGYSALLKATIK